MFCKKVFLQILQKSQENTCARVSHFTEQLRWLYLRILKTRNPQIYYSLYERPCKEKATKKTKKNKFRKPIKKRCQDNRPPDNCSPRQLPPGWLPQENCPPDNYPAPPPDNCPQGKLSPRCLTSDYCSHTITPMIIAPWQYPHWKLSLRKLAFGWFDDNCP